MQSSTWDWTHFDVQRRSVNIAGVFSRGAAQRANTERVPHPLQLHCLHRRLNFTPPPSNSRECTKDGVQRLYCNNKYCGQNKHCRSWWQWHHGRGKLQAGSSHRYRKQNKCRKVGNCAARFCCFTALKSQSELESIFSIFAYHTQAIQDPLKPFKFLESFFDPAE